MAAGAVACGNRLTSVYAWNKVAIRAAQKAVHAVPCDVRSWAVAAAATLAGCMASHTQPVVKYQSNTIRLGQLLLAKGVYNANTETMIHIYVCKSVVWN